MKCAIWDRAIEGATEMETKAEVKLDDITFKGIVHPKMKIPALITHPHVVPNP